MAPTEVMHHAADTAALTQRYAEEREKRLNDKGVNQYTDLATADEYARFHKDPYLNPDTITPVDKLFPRKRCKILVVGAGHGAIILAVHLIKAGFAPEDFCFVDEAGGFGGVWYFNRYPGVRCDTESYCYLPFLEETGYIPKHRYSYGPEIREYANSIVERYDLTDRAAFCTKAERLVWDEAAKEWETSLSQTIECQPSRKVTIRSPFVIITGGLFNVPRLPGVPGILSFNGESFHCGRWDYSVTGGSDVDDQLVKLKDKRVAIIGTGASAIQAIPALARSSKHLYVVQRTPNSVDVRDQRDTDPTWFRKEVAKSKGWQCARNRNANLHFTLSKPPDVNLVDDGWTRTPTMAALAGCVEAPQTADKVPEHIQRLHAMDKPRTDNVRARVDEQVKDAGVAAKLKAWYPSWCKRQNFEDDYLLMFNRDNVTLVDTDGKGLSQVTEDSIVSGDKSYPVDVIVYASGFLAGSDGSYAAKAKTTIIGREGISMAEQWVKDGPATLHGIFDRDFPNLILPGPTQASISVSETYSKDQLAIHTAYMMAEAKKRANGKPYCIYPSAAAADEWGTEIAKRAHGFSVVFGCTPGNFNMEGMLDKLPAEKLQIGSRSGIWGLGVEDFIDHIEAWRAEGNMQGIVVEV